MNEKIEAAKKRRAAYVTEKNKKKQEIRIIQEDIVKIEHQINLIDLELSNQQTLPL